MALIYIVEDDINIREIERYALKNSGFEVENLITEKISSRECQSRHHP